MTTHTPPSTDSRKQERARTWSQIVYALRVLVLLVALGVAIWVYGGDIYVTGVLLLGALGVFAAGIAPGLVPAIVRDVAVMPFVLGTLIPLWRLVDVLFRGEQAPILRAAGVLGAYAIAALLLIRLPTRMRAPFLRWLPKGAIPTEEAEALRRQAKAREGAARQAERERAEREKQAARAAKQKRQPAAESGGKSRFGWGRGKAQGEDAKPARQSAPGGGKPNPFYSAAPSTPDPAPEKTASRGKSRFGRGRGKAQDEDAKPARQSAPGYSAYQAPEEAEDAFSRTGRYDYGNRYDPPGLSRSNPFYAEDDADDDDDAAAGYSWSSAADPGPEDAPEDELLEKIRAMRKKQPKW